MAEVVNMPKLGFDMAEGTLIRWAVAEGETVEKGALLAEIETDKATVEVESMYSGVVHKHIVSEGAIVPVNTPIAVIGEADEEIDLAALVGEEAVEETVSEVEDKPEPAASAPAAAVEPAIDANLPGGVRATPLARRIAEDRGIDLTTITGSGSNGRIVKKDVEEAAAEPAVTATPAAEPAPAPAKPEPAATVTPLVASVIGEVPEDKRVPLSKLRQTIGRRMVDSKQNYPSFYVTYEYDLGPVMALRKQINVMLEGSGEKLSVNDFLVKAVALALRQFPNLNAKLDGDAVLQYGHVNVGNAVAVENGLLTVVCHDADRKSLREISAEVSAKAGRVREGKIQPEDISDSTFSISNLGMFDVEQFVAIINPPEAAILAVGSAKQVPVVEGGELTTGWRMKATISVDHRVSDGAEAARFMQKLAEFLEKPVSLML
ncbi:MAG: 2-oxo acid dehydrogenase subunit E2 [Anaerolineales bacterium]|nr:2-oxo acid dehydrogenase subunit E2 [Anaerolineales bacterium]